MVVFFVLEITIKILWNPILLKKSLMRYLKNGHVGTVVLPWWCSSFLKLHSRSCGTLSFEEVTHGGRPANATAFLLHGLLGSGRNWRTFSRNLLSELSKTPTSVEWRLILIDLRNHGKSVEVKGIHPPHDMKNTAKDLADLVKFHNWAWPDLIIGHSMGGKVALEFAKSITLGSYGEEANLPKQVWVLDSVPGWVNPKPHSGETENVLSTLQKFPSLLPSRKWVVDNFINLGFSKVLSEWMGSNLRKSGEKFTWSFNIQGTIEMYNSYYNTCYMSLLEHPPNGLEVSLVRAENSDRWCPHMIEQLESLVKQGHETGEGKFSLHLLPNAGHWVHIDNPKGLLEIMCPRIMTINFRPQI